jgi:hypothetical protein
VNLVTISQSGACSAGELELEVYTLVSCPYVTILRYKSS